MNVSYALLGQFIFFKLSHVTRRSMLLKFSVDLSFIYRLKNVVLSGYNSISLFFLKLKSLGNDLKYRF